MLAKSLSSGAQDAVYSSSSKGWAAKGCLLQLETLLAGGTDDAGGVCSPQLAPSS